MAFDLRITGVPRDNENPLWYIDGLDYRLYDMMKNPFFRKSIDSTMYLDYIAIVNVEDALDLHKEYFIEAASESYKKKEAELLKHLQVGPPITRWVIFEIYEWESGLD